jgi:putative chitinase
MMITEAQIRRIAYNVNRERVKEFTEVFNSWNEKFQINTPKRAAMFIAHCLHESSCLNRLEENLNYSASALMKTWPSRFNSATAAEYAYKPEKIANKVYANRMGNGSEQSGDGWRFRGRGAIGITGRNNYKAYATSGFCIGDLMSHPEWLAKSPGCYKSAMWFFWKNGLNDIADRGDNVAATKKINGGTLGLAERNYYYRRACKEFGVTI